MRQGQQQLGFFAHKDLVGFAVGGAMLSQTDFLEAPLQSLLVGLVDIPKVAPRQDLLTHYGHTSFHFSFVSSHLHLGRVGHESIVPFQFGVGRVERRIVQIGLEHTVFKIVQDNQSRATPEKRKGTHVAVQPGEAVLPKHKAHEAVAAVA